MSYGEDLQRAWDSRPADITPAEKRALLGLVRTAWERSGNGQQPPARSERDELAEQVTEVLTTTARDIDRVLRNLKLSLDGMSNLLATIKRRDRNE